MSPAAALRTVPAHPLGQPIDGRPRYGMTPEQAVIYRWLAAHKSHTAAFKPLCREVSAATGLKLSVVHRSLIELCERGWLMAHLCQSEVRATTYSFVHPVMHFAECRRG